MNTRSHHALLERTTVVVLLTAVGVAWAAVALGACGGKGDGGPATPTTSQTAVTPSSIPGSPSPGSSATSPPSAAKRLVIAAATGVNANSLSVVSATGQVKQLLAPSGGPLRNLAWSSDGTRLAYLRARSADDYAARLFCYDTTTGKSSQIVFPNEDNEAAVDSFTWVAPTELIVSVIAGGPTYRANGALWLCDVAKGTRKIVKDAGGHVLRGAGVSSSADSTTIAYVSYGSGSSGMVPEKLRLFDADSLAVATVANGRFPADVDGDAFAFPLISRDGSLIYTTQTGSDPAFGCTVWNVHGSKALHSEGLMWPIPGSWSSTGRLAFAGASALESSGPDSVLVWQSGAAKPTAILTPPAKLPITSLAWSPKATQIAYTVSKSSGLNGSLWVVNADGTNRHLLLATGSWPAWATAPIGFP